MDGRQMTARLVAIRDAALARGDLVLAAEAQMELDKLGHVEAAVPEPRERAVPPRPRGRPRKNP